MDALTLLSGDEDDEAQDETPESRVENQQVEQLDFEALKRAGYSSTDDASAADEALQSAFSSLTKTTASQYPSALGEEIPGYKTTFTIIKEVM